MDNLTNCPVSHIEEAIIEYAKQACKEQREICGDCFENGLMEIESSPEPELK